MPHYPKRPEPGDGDNQFLLHSCDPFGTNPYGDQLFDIHPDGTHLRQLTHARGEVTEADGTVSSENVAGGAYSASFSNAP